MTKQNKELLCCVINAGYSDIVMEAAKRKGAQGGTIFHGRGTADQDVEKFFGIKISPDKEIVMIVVDKEVKDDIMKEIYQDAGLDTKGQGIIFSLPVEDFITGHSK